MFGDGGSAFTENISEHIVQFDVGNRQAVLGAVLLTGYKARQLDVIAAQIAKLANVRRRDKAGTHQVALEKLGNPLGVFLVGFLAANSLDVFGVSEDNFTGWLQNVVDRNPVLTCGFHAGILAVVLGKP